MSRHVYFVQRLTGNPPGRVYSYSGFTLAVDAVAGARKVLRDWITENEVKLGLVKGDEILAIKNTATHSEWYVFSLGKSSSLTFMGVK